MQAVVFDLDGVLIDSEPVWEEVRRAYVKEAGGRWLPDAQHRMMGMSTREWATYLSEDLGVGAPPEEVAREVIGRMRRRYAQSVPLLPGAIEAVERLATEWPLGLASSSPRELIDVVLEHAGVGASFRATVSTEEVERGKPAPDGYLAVAARLDVEPAQCVAIEDSSNGLRSAHAAGMRVVAIPRPEYEPAPDALALSAYVAETLADLTVARIAALLPA